MAPTNENSAQSNMTSEVDASVKNSNFEKCKWKKKENLQDHYLQC